MIKDAVNLEQDSILHSDVCIIGTGAAGLTLAKELMGSGQSVLLMESGGLVPEASVDKLKLGQLEGDGFTFRPGYLSTSRMRFFGGTTNIWEGVCLPMEKIDFEAREWMPNSGWPISLSDLEEYYARASDYIGIHRHGDPYPENRQPNSIKVLPADDDWDQFIFHMTNKPRLGTRFKEEIEASRDIITYIQATAILFLENENGGHVEAVEFATLSGNRFRVKARRFVLAAGGIENSRILLNSNVETGSKLANRNDLLGRFFFDQLHMPLGKFVAPNPLDDHWLFFRTFSKALGYIKMGAIALKEDVQRKLRLSNQAFVFHPLSENQFKGDDKLIVDSFSALHETESVRRSSVNIAEPLMYAAKFKSEQGANPENRLTLTNEMDELGVRRLRLHWKISEEDKRMMGRFAELFADAVGRNFIGRVKFSFDELDVLPRYAGGHFHQLGGTRMSSNPTRGVVDENCRVHGTDNLYILGGSVFPSGGRTNPTMTIMALSIRLGELLKKEVVS